MFEAGEMLVCDGDVEWSGYKGSKADLGAIQVRTVQHQGLQRTRTPAGADTWLHKKRSTHEIFLSISVRVKPSFFATQINFNSDTEHQLQQ